VIASLSRYDAIPGGGSNVIVRRGAWQETGPFDARLRNTEDWEMWIRFGKVRRPGMCKQAVGCAPRAPNQFHTRCRRTDTRHQLIESPTRRERTGGCCICGWRSRVCALEGAEPPSPSFAKAALHGEGAGVVRHIRADLRARLAARFPTLRIDDTLVDDPWRVAACQWLQELRSQTGTGDHQNRSHQGMKGASARPYVADRRSGAFAKSPRHREADELQSQK
jgi:hypothetical protein